MNSWIGLGKSNKDDSSLVDKYLVQNSIISDESAEESKSHVATGEDSGCPTMARK